MKNQTFLRLSVAALTVALNFSASRAQLSSAQVAQPPAVAQHIAVATAAAKNDLLGPLGLCKTATPAKGPDFMEMYEASVKKPPLPPMQVMDDLYFLGNYWSSAWAIRTSAGIIVIDALDNSDEAKDYIEGGLRTLGLDPADIKYVIVSHAHGDHYGGAAYLKEKFNPRIVMSEIDWKALEDPNFKLPKIPLFGAPPKRDLSVKDGDTITLGNTTVKLYVIPGHTLGTLATVFTAHDHGTPHNVVDWGGTAYNFGPLTDRLQLYSDTTEKYRQIMKQDHVDVFLSNHVAFDDAISKMAQLKQRKPGEPNPFVVGQDAVDRFLTVLGECALATKAYVAAGQPGK